jgi:hypothetical protein
MPDMLPSPDFVTAVAGDEILDLDAKLDMIATMLVLDEGGPLASTLLAATPGHAHEPRRAFLRGTFAWPMARLLLDDAGPGARVLSADRRAQVAHHGRPSACGSARTQRPDLDDAAHMLGMLPWQAERILGAGPYTLEALDVAAMEHYQPTAHREDPYSYWLTIAQAAGVLGLSVARLKQLATADRVPYIVHRSGQRLMRRHQLEVIANARDVQVAAGDPSPLRVGPPRSRTLDRQRQDV